MAMYIVAILPGTIVCLLCFGIYWLYRHISVTFIFAGTFLLVTLLLLDQSLTDIATTILQMVYAKRATYPQEKEVAVEQDETAGCTTGLAEWPSQDLLHSIKAVKAVLESWQECPHPPELDRLPYGVPTELRDIISRSLKYENEAQPATLPAGPVEIGSGESAAMSGGLLTPTVTSERSSTRSRSLSNASSRSSSDNGHRSLTRPYSIAKALAPSTNAGSMGLVVSSAIVKGGKEKPDKHRLFHLPKKSKAPKPKLEESPKEETILMKFLREQKMPG